MAAAYAVFASGGLYARPTGIREVVLPGGKVDSAWGAAKTRRVLPGPVAWKVNQVLSLNALEGTGAGSGDGVHPSAGKTGTTSDHADAWYVGYTRDLSTAVWMGYRNGELPMLSVHGQVVAGATFAVPIWHLFMLQAEKGLPARPFITPAAQPAYRPFVHRYFGYLALPKAPVAAPKPAPKTPPSPLELAIQATH
jgi:membrane peptidoglycan carboxypeptidase